MTSKQQQSQTMLPKYRHRAIETAQTRSIGVTHTSGADIVAFHIPSSVTIGGHLLPSGLL